MIVSEIFNTTIYTYTKEVKINCLGTSIFYLQVKIKIFIGLFSGLYHPYLQVKINISWAIQWALHLRIKNSGHSCPALVPQWIWHQCHQILFRHWISPPRRPSFQLKTNQALETQIQCQISPFLGPIRQVIVLSNWRRRATARFLLLKTTILTKPFILQRVIEGDARRPVDKLGD